MRILIAEDDAVPRLILRKCIEGLGHECLVAKDGDEAWTLFQAHAVDVVVSDWLMPGTDGIQLCKRIRETELPGRGYTYVILLTSLLEKEHFLEGMQAGADDYLRKPLDREELQVRLLSAARVTSLHHQLTEQKLELQRLNHELYAEGRRDALTRVGNRLGMQEDLPKAQEAARRYGHSYAVAICDIDHYKLFNDHYGHLAGDEVLRQVARCLAESVRLTDTVYRYGGEEFLVLLPEQDAAKAALAGERLRRSVAGLGISHAKSTSGRVTVSVGVASLATFPEATVEELLKRADEALYHAKQNGRNRVAVNHSTSIAEHDPELVS